jgi:diguanylate cyclase (GGDEF)-like protein
MDLAPRRELLTDPLTLALAKAEFEPLWSACVQQAQRPGGRCAVLALDLDHFKSINDAFGHRRGDAVLVEVAQRMRRTIRTSDLLFRLGGDEFALVLPDTGLQDATDLAQRVLQSAVEEPLDAQGLRVSLSIGVAALPDDGLDATALFDMADQRSFAAKRGGRARVVAGTNVPTTPSPLATVRRRVERDDVLLQIRTFLGELRAAGRGVLWLTGPQGAGRSALLQDVGDEASRQDWAVLALPCSPRLRGRPGAVLERALPGFSVHDAAGPDDGEALALALRNVAAARPLLLCVDDVSQLDWHSAHLLRRAMRSQALGTVGLIGVVEDAGATTLSGWAGTLQRQVTLQALSADGLRAWLRMLLQWDPPASFVDWLLQQTGGLPKTVDRLLQVLTTTGGMTRTSNGWQLQRDHAEVAQREAPSWQQRRSPHNLPAPVSSFVGRDVEADAVVQALQRHRLVTLTGAGGLGKTRLALHVAAELKDGFRHGAWFIDLARVSDPDRVPDATAAALGLRKTRGRPLVEALTSWLARRELLLVLDNCEHLLAACAVLCDAVLQAAPQVRLMVTSREPLSIPGEQLWRAPPLPLPETAWAGEPRLLMQCASVRLFLDRAQQVRPSFRLDATQVDAVIQICRRLDGIPLALELAAARLRLLDARQIAQRLDDRFGLLVGGSRTALPRHQTLRAAIDWSHDLLQPAERVLLRRLAVFAGGCTLDAAQAVCCLDGQLPAQALLEQLGGLTDKSLVVVQHTPQGPRYTMLETVRAYARDRLADAGEGQALGDAHLAHVLAEAERAEPAVGGPEQSRWLDQMDAELDNLRAALHWAGQHDRAAMLRLASAQWRFCDLRGHLVEGLEALLTALDHGTVHPRRALAQARAAYMARNLGDFAHAERLAAQALQGAGDDLEAQALALFVQGAAALEFSRPAQGRDALVRALALFQQAGAEGLAGTTQVFLGFEAELRNDVALARHWMLQGLQATRRAGDTRRICHALVRLGFVAIAAGDAAEAVARFEEALALGQAIGDTAYIANGHFLLGRAALFTDDPERAEQLLRRVTVPREGAVAAEIAWAQLELAKVHWAQERSGAMAAAADQALTIGRQAGLHEVQATALVLSAQVALGQGDRPRALALLEEAHGLFRVGRREGLCLCLDLAARVQADQGDARRAALLLAAREALREHQFALDHYPFMLRLRQALVDRLHQALGQAAFTAAWQEGRTLDADAAWACHHDGD